MIHTLLSNLTPPPVLVDIGASYNTPAIWKTIAAHSVYVGFDPDQRGIREIPGSKFQKAIIVNAAVVDKEGEQIPFYLTRAPYCSSTLPPDEKALDQYLFSDKFEVEREVTVKSTTLNQIAAQLSLSTIDWLKTDSQGIDLRLFLSLREDIRKQVLAVDIEPGLIDAYIGEDLFIDAHRELTRQGFWLSHLMVMGTVRMRRSSLAELLPGQDPEPFALHMPKSPGWCEARYLRVPESLAEANLPSRAYLLAGVFALVDGQPGSAVDIALAHKSSFGQDERLDLLREIALKEIQKHVQWRHRRQQIKTLLIPLRKLVKR